MTVIRKVGYAMLYILPAAVCLSLLALALFACQFWLFLRSPGSTRLQVQEFTIGSGMSAAAIARLLQDEGVVADAGKFYLLCLLKKSGHRLKAGEYAFSTFSPPAQILDQLVEGRVLLHRVTVPEGSTLPEVAAIVEQAGLAAAEDVLRLAKDRDFISTLDLPVTSLEGYLFPETYYFARTQNERTILTSMVRQFRIRFSSEWQEQARSRGLSIHQVIILASMVEAEAAVDSERPVIAGVFFNRLQLNMPLQSDPTAVYDLPGFSGPITHEHLLRQSPYNTYQNKGLPVGPICNPGAKSLQAVLYPENIPYLYFVSNNDGTHRFSVTLEEHQRAVSLYRKKGPFSLHGH